MNTERNRWRVGQHYAIHVYEGDTPVCTALTVAYAKQIVADHNAALVEPRTETILGHTFRELTPTDRLAYSGAGDDTLIWSSGEEVDLILFKDEEGHRLIEQYGPGDYVGRWTFAYSNTQLGEEP